MYNERGENLMLLIIGFIVVLLTSIAAWINTKIILEDIAELKTALNQIIKERGNESDSTNTV
jgi:hypothetical protein